MFRTLLTLTALLAITAPTFAQTPDAPQAAPSTATGSIAAEADVLAYGISGYSAIINVTLPSKLQFAFGVGRYEVPVFLLEGDESYEAARWKATATSVQVARVTYRFRGAMKSGPALGVVMLNQNWKLRSELLGDETTFRPLSVGLTGGYYVHLGEHLYLYPTAAFTYNRVISGSTSVNGASYHVEKWAPNASLHAGWEWGRR